MKASKHAVLERTRSLLVLQLLSIALMAGGASCYINSAISSRLVALAESFDKNRISRAADFAAAAYFQDSKFRTWSEDRRLQMPLTFSDAPSETRGFVGVDEEERCVVLSFRGSGTLKNFLTNLNFQLIPFNHSCVGLSDMKV
eukprot:762808-Hanusia_phi.AAC.1